ncbi:MAG: Mucin-21 [Stictis urceolatum]|nr:Mucin-21 [Stictis urceolata]
MAPSPVANGTNASSPMAPNSRFFDGINRLNHSWVPDGCNWSAPQPKYWFDDTFLFSIAYFGTQRCRYDFCKEKFNESFPDQEALLAITKTQVKTLYSSSIETITLHHHSGEQVSTTTNWAASWGTTVISGLNAWWGQAGNEPCCALCHISANTVDLRYWDPITPHPTTPVTAVEKHNNIYSTYTYPSIYFAFDEIYAEDGCSTIGGHHANTMFGFAPSEISSVSSFTTTVNGFLTTSWSSYPIDWNTFHKQNCSTIKGYSYNPHNPANLDPTNHDPCHPRIAIPTGLSEMIDPAWAGCITNEPYHGFYDPPRVLTTETGLLVLPTPTSSSRTSAFVSPAAEAQSTAAAPTPAPTHNPGRSDPDGAVHVGGASGPAATDTSDVAMGKPSTLAINVPELDHSDDSILASEPPPSDDNQGPARPNTPGRSDISPPARTFALNPDTQPLASHENVHAIPSNENPNKLGNVLSPGEYSPPNLTLDPSPQGNSNSHGKALNTPISPNTPKDPKSPSSLALFEASPKPTPGPLQASFVDPQYAYLQPSLDAAGSTLIAGKTLCPERGTVWISSRPVVIGIDGAIYMGSTLVGSISAPLATPATERLDSQAGAGATGGSARTNTDGGESDTEATITASGGTGDPGFTRTRISNAITKALGDSGDDDALGRGSSLAAGSRMTATELGRQIMGAAESASKSGEPSAGSYGSGCSSRILLTSAETSTGSEAEAGATTALSGSSATVSSAVVSVNWDNTKALWLGAAVSAVAMILV